MVEMDISNEARINSFSIGPSSIIGRTIAFRVLFCSSFFQFRQQFARLISAFLSRIRRNAGPAISWFHPRNTQGILVMVTLIAFLLRHFTNVRSRAESAYRRRFWRNLMRSALTYEEWAHAARMLDKEAPKKNESDLYDEELVRNKLQELRRRREEGSLRDIVFCMRADLMRNLGNMCNPKLHKGRLQVPKPIKEYIDEVIAQLKMVCDSDSEELLLEEKLTFMHETRHAFGRTALLLSGGASLGAFHVGVVQTLVENKLLPRIIAGSSVGSIMCAIVATRSWPEIESFFEDSWHLLRFFDNMGGVLAVVKRVMTFGAVHDIGHLQKMLRHLTNNLTFQEAFDMTGRILGITVCSSRKHEPPRCLNYLTSPNVVIWSAVAASCAFPGLFEAQELMAKDRFGEIVPFHAPFLEEPEKVSGASARRWRDGSLESDLPMMQLKELFNVNHFIVSQANPHIAPLLRLKEIIRAYGGNFAAKLAHLAEMEVKHRCNQILELGFPLGGLAKLFAQDWEGDVTVVMPATLAQYSKIIQNPSYVELQKAANQGRRCTWEKLSAIKANCAIELALDESVALLNHMRRLKRSAERAAASRGSANILKKSPSRRIPSWNRIARDNSSSSVEGDVLADIAASILQGTGQTGGPSNKNIHASDSESESIDHNCWTRSGGPLMRTASANKLTIYLQNLGLESESNKHSPREDGIELLVAQSYSAVVHVVGKDTSCNTSTVAISDIENTDTDTCVLGSGAALTASSSIVVSEGDLLQPERTHNGIVLNVVKKEALNQVNVNTDSEQHRGTSPAAARESFHMECFTASSTSEYEDDGAKSSCTEILTSDCHNTGVVHSNDEMVER